MLAANERVRYFHEPFNADRRDPFCFEAAGIVKGRRRGSPRKGLILDVLAKVADYWGAGVVKDFWGLRFVREIRQMGYKVIVICRHPAPVTLSWQTCGYRVGDFYDFIGDPACMAAVSDHLEHIYSRDDRLWRIWMIYAIRFATLARLTRRRSDWVTHEMLCTDPVLAFKRIGLVFNEQGKRYFREHSRAAADSGLPWSVNRDTGEEAHKWRGKFPRMAEMRGALAPFDIDKWGLWDCDLWGS
jgi:hypothetical protein